MKACLLEYAIYMSISFINLFNSSQYSFSSLSSNQSKYGRLLLILCSKILSYNKFSIWSTSVRVIQVVVPHTFHLRVVQQIKFQLPSLYLNQQEFFEMTF